MNAQVRQLAKSPKVSILVAVYNAEKHLRETLDSIISQSYENLEIICINDGSEDSSESILNEYKKKDPRIICIYQENAGAPAARHLGISIASGEFITMIDSDDIVSCNYIESMIVAIGPGVDAVCPILCRFQNDIAKATEVESCKRKSYAPVSGRDAFLESLSWRIHGLILWRTSIVKKVGSLFPGMHGDEIATRMYYLETRRVSFAAGKYYYRINEASVTHTFSLKRFDILLVGEILKAALLESNFPASERDAWELSRMIILQAAIILYWDHRHNLAKGEKCSILKRLKEEHQKISYLGALCGRASSETNPAKTFLRKALFALTGWSFAITLFSLRILAFLLRKKGTH